MGKQKKIESKSQPSLGWVGFILLLLAVGAFAFFRSGGQNFQAPSETSSNEAATSEATAPETFQQQMTPQASSDSSAGFRMPPYFEDPGSVDLAPIKDPATVHPAAQQAYSVAQSKPKLLAQLPCFCYCEKFGHGSLHDCFVTDHAESCDICLKEALHADQMERQGLSGPEIREVIVAQYHPRH